MCPQALQICFTRWKQSIFIRTHPGRCTAPSRACLPPWSGNSLYRKPHCYAFKYSPIVLFQVGLKFWMRLDRLDVCSLSNSWLDSKQPKPFCSQTYLWDSDLHLHVLVFSIHRPAVSPGLELLPQHSPALRDSEIQWFVGVCLLAVKHIPLVYQCPQGSLLLIVPAPISLPIFINLWQITCRINGWIPPALPWAFRMKGYHLPWVDYQSGLLWALPPRIRKIWSGSCRSVHALYWAVGNEISC